MRLFGFSKGMRVEKNAKRVPICVFYVPKWVFHHLGKHQNHFRTVLCMIQLIFAAVNY